MYPLSDRGNFQNINWRLFKVEVLIFNCDKPREIIRTSTLNSCLKDFSVIIHRLVRNFSHGSVKHKVDRR